MSDYDRNLSGPGLNRPNLGQPGFNSTTTDPTYRDRLAASSPAGWIGGNHCRPAGYRCARLCFQRFVYRQPGH